MTQPISPSHSFIVRFWREQREIPGAAPEWRGVIEHVPDGKKHYFRQFEEMIFIVRQYLDQPENLT